MNLLEQIKNNLKQSQKNVSIIFAEGWNKDIQAAANEATNEISSIIPILIFNNRQEIPSNLNERIKCVVINEINLDEYANYIFELRKNKGINIDDAKKLASQPNYLASTMVAMGKADGEICGIEYTTADTLKAALQIVKTNPDTKVACSAFIMEKNGEQLVFGDCSVNINPDSEALASITKTISKFSKEIAKFDETRTAMLSYSSAGSGKGESVDKGRNSFEIVKQDQEFMKDYNVFGEIQFDAANSMKTMQKKVKNLNWSKPANVYIFPDISSGNIGYKIAQNIGGWQAIGPVILGLRKPVNDLSRGATISDVVQLTYITASQAINK